MTTTTREVILRIKTTMDQAMGRNGTAGFKDFAGLAPKIVKQVKDLSSLLPTANKLWMDHAKAIGAAASALSKYNAARMPKEPTASRPGGGSGGGGEHGMGGLGRFGPAALALAGSGLLLNEVRSAAPAMWGAHLHGGPLRRGSLPFVEGVMDTFSGRSQLEWMQDMHQAEVDRDLHRRSSYAGANLGYMTNVHGLQRSLLSAGAAPQEHLDLLSKQRSELRMNLGGLQREQTQIEQDFRRATDRVNIEHANRLQAHNDRMEGKQPLPFGMPRWQDIPMPFRLSPLGLGAAAGSVIGDFMGVGNLDTESKSKANEALLEVSKRMQANLEAQRNTLEKLLANEQQQLELAKGMAQSRQQGQLSYGSLTPTEQRAAITAAQSLQAGQTISPDEQSLLGRAGPYGQKLLQNAAFQNSGGYLDFLQAAGAPQKEIDQMRQGQQATALFQAGTGALGISLPAVEVNLTMNEQLLAQAIAKEVGETMKDVQAKVKQIADQVDRLESGVATKDRQRNTSATDGFLGRLFK